MKSKLAIFLLSTFIVLMVFASGQTAGRHPILSSRTGSTVQLITLDFIQNINVTGSPFKGPADAPIAIAVFSDFQ